MHNTQSKRQNMNGSSQVTSGLMTLRNIERYRRSKVQRKLSDVVHRVTEDQFLSESSQLGPRLKDSLKKSKIDRRDTKDTYGTQNEDSMLWLQIERAEMDPFQKVLLKARMEDDIKSLKKMNKKSLSKEYQPKYSSNVPQNMKIRRAQSMKASRCLSEQYQNVPKDISIMLDKVTLQNRSKKAVSLRQFPIPNHIFSPYDENQYETFTKNDLCLGKSYNRVTFREFMYKKKVENLEALKQVNDDGRLTVNERDFFVDEEKGEGSVREEWNWGRLKSMRSIEERLGIVEDL